MLPVCGCTNNLVKRADDSLISSRLPTVAEAALTARSAGEELLERRRQDGRVDVVLLPLEGATLRARDQLRQRVGGLAQERWARAAVDHDRGHRDGLGQLLREGVVAHDRG